MKMTTKLAASAAIVMTIAGSTSAFAHGHRHGFKFRFHHVPHARFLADSHRCDVYYDRWMDTGRFYWKRKYYICKGWW